MKRFVSVILVLVVLAVVGRGFIYWRQTERAGLQSSMKYATAPVKRGNIVVEVADTAPLEVAAEKAVSIPVGGEVAEVFVNNGEQVEAGQPILRLDTEELELQLEQARVDRELAENRLEEMLHPTVDEPAQAEIDKARLDVENATLEYEDLLTQKDHLKVTAPVSGTVVEVNVDLVEQVTPGQTAALVREAGLKAVVRVPDYDIETVRIGQQATIRVRGIDEVYKGVVSEIADQALPSEARSPFVYFEVTIEFNPGSDISGLRAGMRVRATIDGTDYSIQVDEGELTFNEAHPVTFSTSGTVKRIFVEQGDVVKSGDLLVELDDADLTRQLKQAENQIELAANALEQLLHPELPEYSQAELQAQRLTIKQAELKEQDLERKIEECTITAPAAGIVDDLDVEPGDLLQAGEKIGRITDYSQFTLQMMVDELEINGVRNGQKAVVTIDAVPGVELWGTVTEIARSGEVQDGVTWFPVTVALDDSDIHLRAGYTATATITVSEVNDVLVVPREAIYDDGSVATVKVLKDGEVENREVEVGVKSDTLAEIKSGLEMGEQVITGTVETDNMPFGPHERVMG